jgi:hypothetical protein
MTARTYRLIVRDKQKKSRPRRFLMKRHRRNRQSRPAHIIEERRDPERENKILAASMDDQDSAVSILMRKLRDPKLTEVEAAQIGMELQRVIRGPASLLENMDDPQVSETVHKELEKREKLDRAAEAYEGDRERFVEDVFNRSEKLKLTGERKEKLIAQTTQMIREGREKVIATQANRRLRLLYSIQHEPKEKIYVEGVPEMYSLNGMPTVRILPEVIQIMDQKIVLPPGEHWVPAPFARRHREMMRVRAESEERKKAMDVTNYRNAFEVERLMKAVDNKYGSSHQTPNNFGG